MSNTKKLLKYLKNKNIKYICVNTEDELYAFCAYAKYHFGAENLKDAYFKGYFNRSENYGFPLYLKLERNTINHISFSRRDKHNAEILKEKYSNWVEESYPLSAVIDIEDYPEYFL